MISVAALKSGTRPFGLAANHALDLLLPPTCPGCRAITPLPGRFCAPCWRGLRFIGHPQCAGCGFPFELPCPPGTRCGTCLAEPPAWDSARAATVYDGPARAVVLGLKHGHREHLARAMAVHLARAGGDWLGDATLAVPVPLHRWRLLTRGFNQAAVMARALARAHPVPLGLDALERHRATELSQGLSRDQRARNVAGAFRVAPRWAARVRGARVLLIDDVLTTGATAAACARTLRRGGAAEVRVLTWARVVRGGAEGHIGGQTSPQEE